MHTYAFYRFKMFDTDAPLLERMTDAQRYVLTSKDNSVLMMAHLKCAYGTIKSRRHRARAVLVKLREEANRANTGGAPVVGRDPVAAGS